MYTQKMKALGLNDQIDIPLLGLGTWQLQGQACQKAVENALDIGYRLIDTADAYGNHQQVGQALKSSGLERKDIFLTTKLWRESLAQKDVPVATARFLEELQTDYIDLLLIHWPNNQIPLEETLEAMDRLKNQGIIKAIGVSNFTSHHLADALKTGIEISNNQVELHPSFPQKELVKFCQEKNIVVTAYSPIAQGKDLLIETIQNLAKKYSVSTSQVILNWLIQKNIVAIPRSENPKHIEDNFKSLSWELSKEDIQQIDRINSGTRMLSPNFADFDY